jgi:hypothetical protein
MTGRIVHVQVDYEAEAGQRTTVDLAAMTRHCRPERVEDLLEDLAVPAEDVLAGRRPDDPGRPLLEVIRGQA